MMIRGVILVFLGACSFGILSTFVKLAYREGFSLGEVTGVQAGFGCAILWAIVLVRRFFSKGTYSSSLKDKLKLLVMGTSTGMVSILYYKCVQTVPASIAILLLMQFTWISLLLEAIRKRKAPSAEEVGTVVVILFGTALAGRLFSEGAGAYDWRGMAYGLGAAFCYALFILINNAAGNNLHPTLKSAILLSGACLLIFALFPPVFLVNGSLGSGLLKWGIALALFGTVIPPLFYAYGTPRTGLALGAILSTAELPVAVLMSSIVLEEEVTMLQWLGVLIILVAIVASNYRSVRKSKKKRTQHVATLN